MKHSPSSEADTLSANQEIPQILRQPNVHYRIQQPDTCPHSESQINPVHAPHISWRFILILSSHLSLDHQNRLLPSRLATKFLYAPPLSPTLATCQPHLIFLYLITRIIFGEYRSWSSLLCSLLHSHVTSSLLGPNIFLSTLFSNILSLRYDRNSHV